jgi:OOP family OmpA-OmpF porin
MSEPNKMKTILLILAVACFAVGCASTPVTEQPKEQPKAATPAPGPAAKPAEKPKPEAKKPAEKPKPAPKPIETNMEIKIELQGIAFKKTEMTADNKKDLDEFLKTEVGPLMKKPSSIGAVIITGHTDHIGSEKYNKKLSEQRALGVKDYVVSQGIDQKLIFWEGKAFKQPIPVTKFCENKMPRKQLIECLAPNRRVTVEVVGVLVKPAPKPEPDAKPAAKSKP